MNPTESMLVLGIAALATAIAVGALSVPASLLDSSISQAFMLVIALILFSYSPVVGIAALALFAIIMFHRNVKKTVQYSATLNAIQPPMQQYITPKDTGNVAGYDTMQHGLFEQTYEAYQSEPSPVQPVEQVIQAQAQAQAQAPAPAQEDGMYPEQSTMTEEDVRSESFMYRPGADMGDNTFEPVGTSIDEKYAAFQY
jgi:hypothetical protein